VCPKLPVWEYESTGILSVLRGFSIVDSYLLESSRGCCLLYVTSVGVQKCRDF